MGTAVWRVIWILVALSVFVGGRETYLDSSCLFVRSLPLFAKYRCLWTWGQQDGHSCTQSGEGRFYRIHNSGLIPSELSADAHLKTECNSNSRIAASTIMTQSREAETRLLQRRQLALLAVQGLLGQSSAWAEGLDKGSLRKDYDKYASKYDELDGGAAARALGIDSSRAELLATARGKVLEVGVGTGMNLLRYRFRGDGGEVDSVTAIDLSEGMLAQARAKAQALGLSSEMVDLKQMDVEKLQFPDEYFDTVVDTYGLCVFSNPVNALREMRRVVKPTGQVLLLENSISSDAFLGAYMKATAPIVARVGGKGCFYDQDPGALAKLAGLKVLEDIPMSFGGVLRRLVCVR